MPQFVLLEHCWRGVHYDLMLERGDALATWAIDEQIVRDRILPARRLGAHRVAYLDYEGPISGDRGVVRRLDRGFYEPLEWTDRRVRVVFQGSVVFGPGELWSDDSASGGGAESSPRWWFRLGKRD